MYVHILDKEDLPLQFSKHQSVLSSSEINEMGRTSALPRLRQASSRNKYVIIARRSWYLKKMFVHTPFYYQIENSQT